MTGATFVCCGCRQSFAVLNPEGTEMVLACPLPECRRVLWILDGQDNDRLMLGTNEAPDLSSGDRFVLDCFRLVEVEDGHLEEILAGPADQLEIMRRDLNADPPHDDADLVHRIQDLIQAARPGCTFQPGRRLVSAGRAALALGRL